VSVLSSELGPPPLSLASECVSLELEPAREGVGVPIRTTGKKTGAQCTLWKQPSDISTLIRKYCFFKQKSTLEVFSLGRCHSSSFDHSQTQVQWTLIIHFRSNLKDKTNSKNKASLCYFMNLYLKGRRPAIPEQAGGEVVGGSPRRNPAHSPQH